MNPEGSRNCRECYYPFGLEKAIQETSYTPEVAQGYPPGAAQGYPPGGAPGQEGPPPSQVKVLRVRPLERKRRIHPAVWIVLGVALVAIIIAVAWFLTAGSGGKNPYVRDVFQNMEALQGWEAEVRVDNSEFGLDPTSYNLLGSWEGTLVYQAPDRISLSARSLDASMSYAIRVIDDTYYEWDGYSSRWKNMGPVTDEQKEANPLWDYTLVDEMNLEEEEGLEELDGKMCKVYSFDQDINIEEEDIFGNTYEIPLHFAGKLYIDNNLDLLMALDYIIEVEGLGRSHYRYGFSGHGETTVVEVPPGV